MQGEYLPGTVAMANAGPDTNGSQFFICLSDLRNGLGKQYNLFGQVTSGMDAVQAVQRGDVVPLGHRRGAPDHVTRLVPPHEIDVVRTVRSLRRRRSLPGRRATGSGGRPARPRARPRCRSSPSVGAVAGPSTCEGWGPGSERALAAVPDLLGLPRRPPTSSLDTPSLARAAAPPPRPAHRSDRLRWSRRCCRPSSPRRCPAETPPQLAAAGVGVRPNPRLVPPI